MFNAQLDTYNVASLQRVSLGQERNVSGSNGLKRHSQRVLKKK